jgi:hypothetical protein
MSGPGAGCSATVEVDGVAVGAGGVVDMDGIVEVDVAGTLVRRSASSGLPDPSAQAAAGRPSATSNERSRLPRRWWAGGRGGVMEASARLRGGCNLASVPLDVCEPLAGSVALSHVIMRVLRGRG